LQSERDVDFPECFSQVFVLVHLRLVEGWPRGESRIFLLGQPHHHVVFVSFDLVFNRFCSRLLVQHVRLMLLVSLRNIVDLIVRFVAFLLLTE